VYLVGVRVQGESAAGEIAEAVGLLDAAAGRLGIDTIIVGRGGGSLEDLWAFNEEPVARAIFAASTPIISAVGHETDFTIADFVADLRAATPTAAAELAVPDAAELRRHCSALADRLARRAGERLSAARADLAAVRRSVVFRDPTARVRSARQELAELAGRMRSALEGCRRAGERRLHRAAAALSEHHPRRLLEQAAALLERRRRDLAWALGRRAKSASDAVADHVARLAAALPRHAARLARQRVELLARQLDAMSYRAALRRGYSVTRLAGGAILRRAADAAAGDVLETELIDGKIESQVRGGKRPAAPRKRKGADGAPTLFEDMEDGSDSS
jgi:exodeoxyribonuclease VII large subunit